MEASRIGQLAETLRGLSSGAQQDCCDEAEVLAGRQAEDGGEDEHDDAAEDEPGPGAAEQDGQALRAALAVGLVEAEAAARLEHDRRRGAERLRHQPVPVLVDQDRHEDAGRSRSGRAAMLSGCQPSMAMTSQKKGWTRTGMPRSRNRRSYGVSDAPNIGYLAGHSVDGDRRGHFRL